MSVATPDGTEYSLSQGSVGLPGETSANVSQQRDDSRAEISPPHSKTLSKSPKAALSDTVSRLRKACDSCSIRKVKVCHYMPESSELTPYFVSQQHGLTVYSATRVVRHVDRVPFWGSPVLFRDQVVVVVLQTVTQRLSSVNELTISQITPAQPHRDMEQRMTLHIFLAFHSFQLSQFVTFRRCTS